MIVGIDVGGTNTDIAILEGKKFRTESFRTSEVLQNLSNFIRRNFGDAVAVGIGLAVWFIDGKAVKAPNLPVIPALDLDMPFVVDNDANCFAYFSAKSLNFRNLLGITIGTGIGGGIIADGRVYRGRGAAGEIGHTFVGGEKRCRCGGKGHLEAYFSGWSLKNIRKLIETGEIYRMEEFNLFCRSLANAVMILNPEAVAVGGRIGARLDERFVENKVNGYLPVEMYVAVKRIRDDYAAAKGAALLALDAISQTQP
uniref:ROK family protein n=1 Tax=Archaeoglobus fulgidus TaxID=2234 RepID=A0A7C3MBQ0_ARCFL